VRELKWTKSADVYSFGVLAYEVASGGLLPFQHVADEALIGVLARSTSPIESVLFGTGVAALAGALSQAVPACLLRDPLGRPAFWQLGAMLEPRQWPVTVS
jgi:hypothetical protein